MRAMSLTNCFVSRVVVEEERSCESFARRQGCEETWTLEGREAMAIVEGVEEESEHA